MNDKIRIANAVRRVKIVARVIGTALLAYALFLSASHITEVGHMIGLAGIEAGTLFVFVDVMALFGKLLTLRYFVAKTRRIGYKLMLTGGLVSLVCNVTAGDTWGARGYGAGIVCFAIAMEYATMNIKGKQVNTEPRRTRTPKAPDAVELTARQIAARKGAETRRRNAAAQVSPATVAEIDSIVTS